MGKGVREEEGPCEGSWKVELGLTGGENVHKNDHDTRIH